MTYIAPIRAVYVSGDSDAIGFSFRKTGMMHTQLFRNPNVITAYLDNLGYTGRIVITKQDLTKLNNRTDIVTNTSINVDTLKKVIVTIQFTMVFILMKPKAK